MPKLNSKVNFGAYRTRGGDVVIIHSIDTISTWPWIGKFAINASENTKTDYRTILSKELEDLDFAWSDEGAYSSNVVSPISYTENNYDPDDLILRLSIEDYPEYYL